jgi:hypothetical protein
MTAKVATVLGLIPASSDTLESEAVDEAVWIKVHTKSDPLNWLLHLCGMCHEMLPMTSK